MKPSEKLVDALPASAVLEALLDLRHFYFPESEKARYLAVCERFEAENQLFWIERVKERFADIYQAAVRLGGWLHMTHSELLVSAWDDEVLFFYILRTQFIFGRIASVSEASGMVPGRMEEFYKWCMIPKKDETWMLYPALTAEGVQKNKVATPIWKIPFPKDYPR